MAVVKSPHERLFFTKDKVYIDGSCGSKTVADVLLACLKRMGYVTYY